MLRYARVDALCLVRSFYFLVFSVGFAAGFYLMFTVVVRDVLSSSPEFARNYMLAMSVSGAFFGALNGGGIRLGAERGDGWTRQVLLTPLSGPSYLGAKAITAWLLTLPAVLVTFLLGALVNNVTLPPTHWLAAIATIWFASLTFVATGLAIGLLATGEAAQFAALAVFFPLAMLGGLWFPIDSLPQLLRHIADFLPTRAVYQLAEFAINNGTGSAIKPLLVLTVWTAALTTLVLSRSRPAVLVRV
ncbi:MAG TPA: ABC transporter permease [Actinophytocola sp.]|jgi:ABC-2 type transport system permease protein|uniref:ABC transporter permease n=1 Tax=Actinophytocola sp. TaxID=1872138 RepID=UPI002E09F728|nr:ABC transporter permease [Actinophytocola sp.]